MGLCVVLWSVSVSVLVVLLFTVYLLRCGWFEVYCCLLVVIDLFGCGLYMSVLVGLLFGSLVLVGLWLV